MLKKKSIEKCLADFSEHIKKKALRMTRSRRIIIKNIADTAGHFDADSLFVELRKKNVFISRATIYRTLDLLTSAGLIKKTAFTEGKFSYEYAHGQEHHDHIICLSCGLITEFKDEVVEARQRAIAQKHGFSLTSHTHKIYGYCPKCKKNK